VVELSEVYVRAGQKGEDRSMYPGVPDARTIQEAQKVQERQPGEEAPVYLSDKLGLVDTRHVHIGIEDNGLTLLDAIFRLSGIRQLIALGGRHVAGKRRRTGALGEASPRLGSDVLKEEVEVPPLRNIKVGGPF